MRATKRKGRKKRREEKKREKGGGGGGGGGEGCGWSVNNRFIFDEGYTLKGRNSSYFGLFSNIKVVGCVFALRGCLAEF